LQAERYGLTDVEQSIDLAGIVHINASATSKDGQDTAPLKAILHHLEKTYCGRTAYEFMHIPNQSERRWFAHRVESIPLNHQPSDEYRKTMLKLLSRSEVFDHFMQKKFAQVKRYGLEGAESMMVVLDRIFRDSSRAGLAEIVIGMPHRGRLNVLTDLLEFAPRAMFHKIKGHSEVPAEVEAMGDVLSHLATSPKLDYGNAEPLHVALLPNPSHLEAINPVAMGKARAKQADLLLDLTKQGTTASCSLGDKVMSIQLHGDAAFTGQGVVMESLGLSNLPHFTSGGSIHIIVNNQLGYTTPATNARSTIYTSDIGKMINAPIIHVNGDYPEEVAKAASIAYEYREKFRKDIVIDLITYRRWGHNELDEPGFTQPLMYENIRSRKSVPRMYEEKLVDEGVVTQEAVDQLRKEYADFLDGEIQASESYTPAFNGLTNKWQGLQFPKDMNVRVDTGVAEDILRSVGQASVNHPSDFTIHPRLQRYHIQTRLQKVQEGKRIDWATAEAFAFGSLLLEDYSVRICGQDVGRGTFSQRHAMLVCQRTERAHIPLNDIQPQQGMLEVANSSLSEFAVMGFEYGMSIENSKSLNIWEAQFGDFFNTAQVIIDAFIASGETKWLKQSGLTLLLPHGFDGAGPEHSSCRMERFLQMCDDPFYADVTDAVNVNMGIVNPTTPAQYFHLLRRQMKRDFRKPLVVVAPKTLLRLPAAVSLMEEMTPGTSFQPVLADETAPLDQVKRVVLVSGKLYYDLIKQRQTQQLEQQVAILRVEELCPFPRADIQQQLARYPQATQLVWCQEEPQNAGAYAFVAPRILPLLPPNLREMQYVGRKASAAPATGVSSVHKIEQATLLEDCFRL
jgi:probable 2-oxoglutarate dehydrogenase E1 component DHKTD1